MRGRCTMKIVFIFLLIISFVNANEWFAKLDNKNNSVPDGTPVWSAIDDKKSNLMWEAKTSGNINDVYKWREDSNSTYPAIEYCENLVLNGFNDWRLPNVNEFKSLIDYTTFPVINNDYFKVDLQHVFYWSSSTVHLLQNDAWYLNVENGLTFYNGKNFEYAVRCVRGGF